MHTLLNATKANVCASIVPAKSLFESAIGINTALIAICGMNAIDSSFRLLTLSGAAEERCSRVLYGEKLWRWSIRVRWYRKVCCRNGLEYMAYIRRMREMNVVRDEVMRMVRERLKNLRMRLIEDSCSIVSVGVEECLWTAVEV